MLPDVSTVRSSDIHYNREWITRFLEMVDDRTWTVDDVLFALENKEAQLWVLGVEPTGIIITRLGFCGSTRTGLIWIAAGEGLERGVEVYRQFIEPWFRDKGCQWVEIVGRKGWKKVFTDFEEKAVVLSKRLSNEQISGQSDYNYH